MYIMHGNSYSMSFCFTDQMTFLFFFEIEDSHTPPSSSLAEEGGLFYIHTLDITYGLKTSFIY